MPGLINMHPKVGIRPTIDGRLRDAGSVAQTRDLAESAARFIRQHVKYTDGRPIEVVIGEGVIGNVEESARVAKQFADQGVGVELSTTPFWCYGTETISMHPTNPKAIYGKNGTERPGAVYLAASAAGHDQSGIPVFKLYDREVQDASDNSMPKGIQENLLRFIRAGVAVATMKDKSYLRMGGTSMGIAGSRMNHTFFEDTLGMRVEEVDMSEMRGRMDERIYDPKEYDKALGWVREKCKEGKDYNSEGDRRSREHLDIEWHESVQMALIARDLMVGNPRIAELSHMKKSMAIEKSMGHNAILAGFQGQRSWTDYQPNGDFLEAINCSSFDWNGKRAPYLIATENDALNGAAMLMNYLLTNTTQIFADVRTYWSPESIMRVTGAKKLSEMAQGGLLHLINSGPAALDGTGQEEINGKPAMKPYWDISDEEVAKCLAATTWHPSDNSYFPGGGWSTRFTTRDGMPVTMARINIIKGIGPVLQIAEGYTVELDREMHDTLDNRTNPTWPTTWFALKPSKPEYGAAFEQTFNTMNEWGANHGAFSYGHIGADLITLAAMLRIPVSMHNVDEAKMFRPSVWSACGTKDREAADYRACANFGPLYAKLGKAN